MRYYVITLLQGDSTESTFNFFSKVCSFGLSFLDFLIFLNPRFSFFSNFLSSSTFWWWSSSILLTISCTEIVPSDLLLFLQSMQHKRATLKFSSEDLNQLGKVSKKYGIFHSFQNPPMHPPSMKKINMVQKYFFS